MTQDIEVVTYIFDHIETLLVIHSAKHHMFVVQPFSLDSGDEKLSSIGVWARVGHGQETRGAMLHKEVLILELGTIDALATSPIKVVKIPTLKTPFNAYIRAFFDDT